MFTLRVLSREVTEKVLKLSDVISTVEEVYRLKAMGETAVFPLVFHEFEPGVADMDIKSGWLKGSDIFGLKVVSWFGENTKKDLPALIGTVLVMDAKTGVPQGILDGSHITGIRTGAAGAIGAKLLARKDSKSLMVVGAGHVATFQVAATLTQLPDIEKVYVYDALSQENAERFAASMPEVLTETFEMKDCRAVFEAVTDLPAATRDSDIIITVTPSKEPIIRKEWVKPGTHFSCIGADMSGKEEIDAEIFDGARVFTDDTPQCINVGEIEIPIKKGILKAEDIAGEIGEILTGKTCGRESDEQITVFDATGTALLDLLTAKLALSKALEQGLGETVNL
ncbi:ornithine cyclodeaminase family protein [Anaerotruncus sp. 80]|jgi:ornithine cyclodeaminase/alanine dehydrogenase|uniref:Ornithine cyclodeaminase family protein n=1 Tax=Anaerotruncus colihominis TaxID=169435 RepID=A0A845QHF0_9FIRM|nr:MULTISPECIES: ornithine cyclodeaminase family protein [Clostridia]MCI9639876.1 ornithine cyclodeaminase family protein [Emergencia sp.]NBH60896.1 ornithine cyclodeaminase family protein [Anaerotruncus colihominis]NCE98472.1 ornithine cyclodeaminase family protein [Emergencia sp. 1XD21-10]NCF01551.1 ornithine cyclodeaminase family protein [Anaerotruncus sp. 80]